MTRILERSDTGPLRIAKDEIEGDAVHVCRCGLSSSQPFCDGTHKRTRSEPEVGLVRYVREGDELRMEPVEVRGVVLIQGNEANP